MHLIACRHPLSKKGIGKTLLMMKFTVFLLLAVCLNAAAKGYAQRISISEENAPLEKIFREIRKQTGYTFVYKEALLQKAKKVSVSINDASLEQALDICLQDQPLSYSIISKTIVVKEKELVMIKEQISIPPVTIQGKITNEKGEPLAGASVMVKGSNIGTITNDKGEFVINVPDNASTLIVSYIGMEKAEVSIKGKSMLNISLAFDAVQEQDVVMVGYTARKKELLTGSVAQIKMKQSDVEIPTTSLGNLLAGKMAGVGISTPNGFPGSQPSISIRTASSWNPAPVLYVIDGKISGAGDFNNLSPNEIDNVTVLKDAATTAAYGSRAAGGVILVTTKRGSSGKATISYSVNTGQDKRSKSMDLVDIMQWGTIHSRIWGTATGPAGTAWTSKDSLFYATHDFGSGYGYGYDLLGAIFVDPRTTTHNLNISGGSDKIKYFVGGSYVNQETFLRSTNYNKYNLRANITADLTKDISIFGGMSLSNTLFSGNVGATDGNSIYSGLLNSQPYFPSYTRSGLPVDWGWITNRAGEADGLAGYNKNETVKPVINLSATYKAPFLKGMSAKASFMKSYSSYQNKIFTSPFRYYQVYQPAGNSSIWDIDSIVGSRMTAHTPQLQQVGSWSQDKQLNLQLAYDRAFGAHHVSGTVVYEGFEAKGNGVNAWITGFPLYTTDQWWAASDVGIVNNAATKGVDNNYGAETVNGRKSWVGQFFYDYGGKYMANFTYRYDGSMNFAPDYRWGFFPSGSVGWIVSKEKFFQNVKGIDNLKVRASVGLTGNDNVGGWQWQETYRKGGAPALGTSPALANGIQYGSVVNPYITWEKYFNKNIGVDIAFLKNFDASIEYWRTKTYDILSSRANTTPSSFSLSLPAVNYGEEIAHGIDLSLNYHKKFGQVNFSAGAVGSYGYAWYTVRDQAPTYDYQDFLKDGRSTTYVTGYVVDHMIRTQAELDKWNVEHPGYRFNGIAARVGQFVYKDFGSKNGVNVKDSVINAYDVQVLRKRNNPVVVGLNLGAEWKGLSINAQFNGSLGFWKSYNDLIQFGEWNRGWRGVYDQTWLPTNTNARLPQFLSNNDGANTMYKSMSNFWLTDASFLRLKNLNIAYTIPTKYYSKYLSGIRFYASGANLFVISKFNKYYDPEVGSGNAFPIIKSYNAGCTITF